MLSEEKKFEVAYDHYKDTFTKIEYHCKLRDRLFLYILLVLSLVCLGLFSYSEAEDILSQFISSKLGISSVLDVSFVGSLIWFGLLSLVIRYFQTVTTIERYYPYLHKLEKWVDHRCGEDVITREGKSYLENYPWFSVWVHFLYTILFPILLLIISALKISNELAYQWPITKVTSFNFFIFICLVISTLLYLRLMHYKK